MKRAADLFPRIIDRDNLRWAFYRAARGKRDRVEVQRFAARLEENLAELARQVERGTVELGRSRQFTVHDPKRRTITAPCFRERVLHHAIINICEPHLERFLICDCYACRVGKGRIAAVQRALANSRVHAWAVKLDIRRYFESVDQATLLRLLVRRFKDRRLLQLLGRILASHESSTGRGLPIGSLTSQHLANFYLGWFDRFVKEQLRVRAYLRYMDDCVLWGESRDGLSQWVAASSAFLRDKLRLTVKEPSPIVRVQGGLEMLGCRVFPDHLQLSGRSRRRYRRRLLDLEDQFTRGRIDSIELQQRATSLHAFTVAGGVKSWRTRHRALQRSTVSGH